MQMFWAEARPPRRRMKKENFMVSEIVGCMAGILRRKKLMTDDIWKIFSKGG